MKHIQDLYNDWLEACRSLLERPEAGREHPDVQRLPGAVRVHATATDSVSQVSNFYYV